MRIPFPPLLGPAVRLTNDHLAWTHSPLLRFQLWSLDKKLRVIRTAKDYVKRHESDLQAQLAQDKTFRSRLQQAKMQTIRFFLVGHIHQFVALHILIG